MKSNQINVYELLVEKALEETGIEFCKMITRDDVMFVLYLSDFKRGVVFVDESGNASFSYKLYQVKESEKEEAERIISEMNAENCSYYLSLRKGGEIVSQYDFTISFDDTVTAQIKNAMEWFIFKNKNRKDTLCGELSK